MGLSDELRAGVGPLWEKVVDHPFVTQLGDGTLPRTTFDIYFDQDYLFLKDWSVVLSLAAAKAPDFEAARHLVGFLHLGLGGEEGLFQQAFKERGLSPGTVTSLEYRPTTQHYSGFLRRIAYEGSFIDLAATLLAMEWPYLDWAQRLVRSGQEPENYYYKTWIDIHSSREMADFVAWLRRTVDFASVTAFDRSRLQSIFRDVLRYELLFWEMACNSEEWPE
jgi:thiaminase/transcriptional activator TenA